LLLLLMMMMMMKCNSIYSMQVETNKCESRRRVREGMSLCCFLKLLSRWLSKRTILYWTVVSLSKSKKE
jgi:hypothetical protein